MLRVAFENIRYHPTRDAFRPASLFFAVAKAHDSAIEEDKMLAGALSNVELGDEIPAGLTRRWRKS